MDILYCYFYNKKKEFKEKIRNIIKCIKYDMLKEEGEIISRSERLRILTSILSKQFQYHKLDSTKRQLIRQTNAFSQAAICLIHCGYECFL